MLWRHGRPTEILGCMATVCVTPRDEHAGGAPCSAMLAQALAELAELQFRLGDWAGAYASTVESLRRAGSTAGLSRLALIDAGRGRAAECRRHASEAVQLSAQGEAGAVEALTREALGLLELGSGRTDAAIERLEWVAHLGAEHPRAGTSAAAWALDLADAYLLRGDTAAARRALVRLERRSVRACGREELEGLFDRALARSAQAPLAFERGRASLYGGERLQAAWRPREANERLRAALHTFRSLGADPWARRACRALAAA